MNWNDQKVLANIRQAKTDDLLDRITAYRPGMEPQAVTMIEQELFDRGITLLQIHERQAECQQECILQSDGSAVMCSLCRKPAIKRQWGWHRVWGWIPLIPRIYCYCKEHVK